MINSNYQPQNVTQVTKKVYSISRIKWLLKRNVYVKYLFTYLLGGGKVVEMERGLHQSHLQENRLPISLRNFIHVNLMVNTCPRTFGIRWH